jgi:methionyl-tRNA formyltransferase
LGCLHVVSAEVLARNKHNLVVHESDLPSGRGFAPMAWQILEGKKRIPVCLIEATDKVDAGDIWLRDVIMLDGSELCDEWRVAQGMKTVELCMRFVDEYERLKPIRQEGEPSWYARRRPADSRLDPDKTIREQFGLLKVSDNDRYPAYFEIDGTVYFVQVSKTHERQ